MSTRTSAGSLRKGKHDDMDGAIVILRHWLACLDMMNWEEKVL